jgi:hypothetical protein
MTENKLIATLNYTALTLSRRVIKLKKLQEENPDFNIEQNLFLKEAINNIEKSVKELRKYET